MLVSEERHFFIRTVFILKGTDFMLKRITLFLSQETYDRIKEIKMRLGIKTLSETLNFIIFEGLKQIEKVDFNNSPQINSEDPS